MIVGPHPVTTRPIVRGVGITAVTLAIMVLTLVPFLPGGYDTLAVPLSTMAQNLLFEQAALHFGTREFVVYNPLDRQAVTSHRLDRLQLTPSELALEHTRGHNAVHDAGHPHWKYFWFD